MPESSNLLAMLQYADSFFPSGGIAFSWGLEALRTDAEILTREQVAQFLEGQLMHRWSSFDAPVLVAALRAQGDVERLEDLDRQVETMTLAPELREGSRRTGTSLLRVHAGLGTLGCSQYQERIGRRTAYGHLPVVQGLVWNATGLGESACRAMSAHTLCTGILGAALRLALIGHLDAQQILLQIRPVLADLLRLPVANFDSVWAYTPHAEIAAMRHEAQDFRLFAN